MDTTLLTEIGLTETQANVYAALLEHGPHAPPKLAKLINESRTNTYNVLEKLTELELVHRYEKSNKYVYQASAPTALEKLARQKREAALWAEQKLHAGLPTLLSTYFAGNEQPGVRFFQGKDGIKEMYMDQIRIKEPIYLIRTHADIDFYGFDFMHDIRQLARKNNIKRHALTPDSPESPLNWRESDPYMLLTRTWMRDDDYTAPVEWDIYGDKVAIISFGEEAIGMIIESPQIAESFRQLYRLLEEGLKRRPDYKDLPKHAKHIGSVAPN